MDKHTGESSKQSVQKDDTEETLPLSEDSDHEDRSAQPKDETHLSESPSRKEYQVEDVDASVSTVVHQDEVEFKDIEATDLSKDEENFHSQSVIKLETKTSIDNASSKMCASKSFNPQMESGSSAEVDVPTHQASGTSISSTTISTSLFKRSEPIAIPSTSRDSSGLAPEESSPRRPANFGPNVKQAIHVFHPRNPKSVLHRFPVPYRGRWTYLRDSPESSDYGGSPDSLDDPFLMEALDIDTPENEIEDSDTPHFEERPLCSPYLLNPIDSLSESGKVGGAIGDEPSESGHIEASIEDFPSESGHIKTAIEDFPSESGHIEASIEDIPSESGHTEATIDYLPSDYDHIIRTIGGLTFESGHDETIEDLTSKLSLNEEGIVDLPCESAIIERSLLNSPSVRRRSVIIGIDTTDRSIEEIQYESDHSGLLQGTDEVGTLPHESGYSERCMDDLVSDSAQGEMPIEDLPSQSGHIDESNGVVASESDHIQK